MDPVTGPFYRSLTGKGPPYLTVNGTWAYPTHYTRVSTYYRQKWPYTKALYYDNDVTSVKPITGGRKTWAVQTTGACPPSRGGADLTNPTNRALEKFKDRLGSDAALATNFFEWRQSLGLIEELGLAGYRFARNLRRFDFKGAAAALGVRRPSGLKQDAKAFGDNFLKFHFGVEPLVKDIYAAVDILQGEPPPKRVISSATYKSGPYLSTDGLRNYSDAYETKVRLTADVRVVNPNLWAANQLGLVNPAEWVWEAIPFSFVLDWFVNVGSFLSSFTDYAGLQLSNQHYSTFQIGKRYATGKQSGSTTDWLGYQAELTRIYQRRRTGFPAYVLAMKSLKAPSATRAATAIALLVQQLR